MSMYTRELMLTKGLMLKLYTQGYVSIL